jgi:hypothetical protein
VLGLMFDLGKCWEQLMIRARSKKKSLPVSVCMLMIDGTDVVPSSALWVCEFGILVGRFW